MSERCTKEQSLQFLIGRGLSIATVLDVGVQHQTRELRENFVHAKHMLFEPVREYHAEIRKNYAARNYELFEVALADVSGDGTLQTFDITGGGGISHSTIGAPGADVGNGRTIATLRLDDFIARHPCADPFLLKIDVDGAELKILQGSVETLKRCACVVIECPISIDERLFFERAQFLRDHGFQLWDIVDFCYYKGQLSQVDLVFLRNDVKTQSFSPWVEGPFDVTQWETKWQ